MQDIHAEYLETFPRRPSAVLVQLIHDRCGTQKELSLRSGISEATISRMCSDDNFRYDIRQITRIVISLHMLPLLSAALMESILFPDSPAHLGAFSSGNSMRGSVRQWWRGICGISASLPVCSWMNWMMSLTLTESCSNNLLAHVYQGKWYRAALKWHYSELRWHCSFNRV